MTTDAERLVYVQEMQEDPDKLNGLTRADADDLFYTIVREYAKKSYRDKDNYKGPGHYGTLKDVMFNTTLVNLAKIAQLCARDEFLFRMWAGTLETRGGNERNKCIGSELEILAKLCDRHYASEEELNRFLVVYQADAEKIRLAICKHHTRGYCRHGDECNHMHLDSR